MPNGDKAGGRVEKKERCRLNGPLHASLGEWAPGRYGRPTSTSTSSTSNLAVVPVPWECWALGELGQAWRAASFCFALCSLCSSQGQAWQAWQAWQWKRRRHKWPYSVRNATLMEGVTGFEWGPAGVAGGK